MPIPDYQDCMLPLLQVLADGESHSLGMVARMIADCFRLTNEERQQLLPSESQTVISNRVAWAKT